MGQEMRSCPTLWGRPPCLPPLLCPGSIAVVGNQLALDVGAVASLIALLPNHELPPPAVDDHNDDARQLLFQMYMQMRERGGVSDEGKWVDEIEALKAEVERLRAGPTPAEPSPPVALPPNVAVLPRPAPKNAPVASAAPPSSVSSSAA